MSMLPYFGKILILDQIVGVGGRGYGMKKRTYLQIMLAPLFLHVNIGLGNRSKQYFVKNQFLAVYRPKTEIEGHIRVKFSASDLDCTVLACKPLKN